MPFPAAPPVIPDVELSAERALICWRPGGLRQGASFQRLLPDFVNLSDDSDVLAFAEKYGPLYLCCKHNRPVMHRHDRVLCPQGFQNKDGRLILSEPVAAYLQLSRRARALIGAADKVRGGEPITADEWEKAGLGEGWTVTLGAKGNSSPSRLPLPTHGVEAGRLVGGLVNLWLTWGDPRPRLALRGDGRFELQFVGGDQTISGVPKGLELAAAQLGSGGLLFGAIAVQIASAVGGGSGLATCSNCGVFYAPNPAPVLGRHCFCLNCGPRAAWRLSKRKARHRKSRRGE
jgi:hypothetical protein